MFGLITLVIGAYAGMWVRGRGASRLKMVLVALGTMLAIQLAAGAVALVVALT